MSTVREDIIREKALRFAMEGRNSIAAINEPAERIVLRAEIYRQYLESGALPVESAAASTNQE